MECHRTGTKAGRVALRWKSCGFTRLVWNWAGTVLLLAMLPLSALSAKDFAAAIVGRLCMDCWERNDNLVIIVEDWTIRLDVADADDVRHRASSSARNRLRSESQYCTCTVLYIRVYRPRYNPRYRLQRQNFDGSDDRDASCVDDSIDCHRTLLLIICSKIIAISTTTPTGHEATDAISATIP